MSRRKDGTKAEGNRAMTEVTAFRWVPDFARGFVRDLRVRWALEEVGRPYAQKLISLEEKLAPDYLRRQPFAQVPAYRDGDIDMFESGAIVLHIAEGEDVLLPGDAQGRARAMSWVFAAMNSVEPMVMNVRGTELFSATEAWAPGYLASAAGVLHERLARLSHWMGGRDYLEDRFTVGDLLMSSVLREVEGSAYLAPFPALEDYCARCTSRSSFKAALEAQLAAFDTQAAPAAPVS
jgi:glutathione S-transferase